MADENVEVHPAAEVPPVETPPVETPPVETPPVETPPEETPPAEETPSEPGALDCTGFKFEGHEVTVEIPEDLKADLSSKGIDAHQVVKELYTSEDFSLSPETKKALDDAFGKATVDSYLGALKDQNRLNMKTHSDQQAAATQAEESAWTETVEQVGSEETWNLMEEWALKGGVSDAELDAFNAAMQSGNRYIQKLAISDMFGKFKAAEGDTAPTLIQGDNVPSAVEGQALSYSEYIALFKSGEYKKNPALYDALRRKGQAMGI